MPRFLLDTTVLIDASQEREPALTWLRNALRQVDEIGVCAVTVAEFFAGLQPHERPRWAAFVSELTYWEIGRETAMQAGSFRYDFARRGRTILIADALIAATAATVGATLVTETIKDFPMLEVLTMRPMP
jgi:predicted nucleic acid-binding protein